MNRFLFHGRLFAPPTAGLVLGALLALALPNLIRAAPIAGETSAPFTDDGGWCWFSDPRALAREGQTYAGWVTADGSVQIGAWAQATGRITRYTLHAQFERDDHDNPALLFLPDGRLAAFYSLHASGDMRLRITTRPGDISEWQPERSLGFITANVGKRGTTYANPVLLTGEGNAIYLFWRGTDFKPTFAISRDLGETWSAPRTLLARPGADDTNRPYLKLSSDGVSRIDFVFTDGHPRNEATNSVYYLRYEHGEFFKADGTRLGGIADLPLDPSRCDRLYDGTSRGRAWIWDIATGTDGRPVIAYTRLPAENEHHYAFARWDGKAWLTSDVCPAGAWFPQTPAGKTEREPHYSGGMALDRSAPFTLYTSRRIEGIFEIERWHSADQGTTWSSHAITAHSRQDNVRPCFVRDASDKGPALLWLSVDHYEHYTNYHTAVKAADRDGAPVVPALEQFR